MNFNEYLLPLLKNPVLTKITKNWRLNINYFIGYWILEIGYFIVEVFHRFRLTTFLAKYGKII